MGSMELININTTFNNGSLGFHIDEERSERAKRNVNCRIQWIIESLNASCTPWYSEEYACLSVVNTLKLDLFFIKKVIVWIWMLLRLYLYYRGSSRNVLAGPPRSIIKLYGVIRTQILCSAIVNRPWDVIASNSPLTWTISLCYLTSNQVGLPAELKHINKRRKRN